MAKTFKELKVWQRAHELVLAVYRTAESYPVSERYGLTSQIRRSAASVATNIVEGHKRASDKDFAHFLNMADGSLEETKYHLLLAHDLNYLDTVEYEKLMILADEVGRMLAGFQRVVSYKP